MSMNLQCIVWEDVQTEMLIELEDMFNDPRDYMH